MQEENTFKLLKNEFIQKLKELLQRDDFFSQNLSKINDDLVLLKNITNPQQLYGRIMMSNLIYGSMANYIVNTYGIKINDQQCQNLKEFQDKLEQLLSL